MCTIQYIEDCIARSLKKLERSGDAGFVPPKVVLLKQIKTLENQYQSEPSATLLKEIEALKLKYQTSGR
ncbi:hypothetical protein [Thalassotalea sp. PS06]|uniref:hypothetical protein n=1 Tax=Thalassotalea sp. PS06 TaxID=2594005 RepID=UPI001161F7CA|nr:hypothetical protein [Thalassotalea sp. PS06]QDP02419.1 hypothetical protein FNC98_14320 [Thalassotalea sp. PS06]